MNKNDVIEFFDAQAPKWDEGMIRYDDVIDVILDNAGIRAGVDVLDVACGTGVLFPDYLKRGVGSLTAIDISPKMAEIARSKFADRKVRVLCGDVEQMDAQERFDCIVVYNAFPHFPDPDGLIRKLSSMLKDGGVLTVAHGMSRAQIDYHHSGSAHSISNGLMHEDELAEIFAKYLTVTVKISDERMYQVAGKK